jgi:hypothetical protein
VYVGVLDRPAPGDARHSLRLGHRVPSPAKASGDPPSGDRETIQRPARRRMTALGHKNAGDDQPPCRHPRQKPSTPPGRLWSQVGVDTDQDRDLFGGRIGQSGGPDPDRWHGLVPGVGAADELAGIRVVPDVVPPRGHLQSRQIMTKGRAIRAARAPVHVSNLNDDLGWGGHFGACTHDKQTPRAMAMLPTHADDEVSTTVRPVATNRQVRSPTVTKAREGRPQCRGGTSGRRRSWIAGCPAGPGHVLRR